MIEIYQVLHKRLSVNHGLRVKEFIHSIYNGTPVNIMYSVLISITINCVYLHLVLYLSPSLFLPLSLVSLSPSLSLSLSHLSRPDLMVKKLRYYARFIVVCLLLKKMKIVRDLVRVSSPI